MPDRLPPRRRSVVTFGVRLVTILLAALAGSFVLWDPLTIDEEAHLQRITQHSARGVRAGLAAALRTRLLTQVRLARLFTPRQPASAQAFEVAQLAVEHEPGTIAIEWFDPNGESWKTIARGVQQHRQLASIVRRLATTIQRSASAADEPYVAAPFALADGSRIGAMVAPIGKAAAGGFLLSIFDVKAALDNVLAEDRAAGFSIAVIENGTEIYRTEDASSEFEQRWAHDGDIRLPGVMWRVRVWPGPEVLGEAASALPELALVIGALLGFMVMATLYDARAAQGRSEELHRIREELEVRVSERTRELQHANQALQDLSGRLLKLQDEERRRIARELHDSTAQMLGAVAINIAQARRLAEQACPAAGALLEESAEFIDSVTAELRTVSYLLHPPLLDELGLEYVLPWYAEGFSKRSGIDIDVELQPGFGRLSPDIELTLFRIVQEALSNVHRHSGSHTARIGLWRNGDRVELEVGDNGRGLAATLPETTEAYAALGVGIAGMRERARQLGGHLEITGGERGTVVRAVLPVRAAEESAA